ncbi:MAG: zinc ABC transporter permease [Alphaproteobacteria bacterium RIFCSPHIGHO2_01_FULL_41_14]|nr:MAG: zinc ABC transporter permease [Alphaproteobacteria bacterium GWB1_45_5]OFW76395.1 MAG: zinc ABC transporter permease [Alphaproteobacteria bacterium GWA1_45_9]OFW89330.1 MAG: zinc ABC transporter permease [Alphaproteobacteria bacterium RIFCSPHIGHO2_01_FULL_41_14]HCI48308.1 zinc ABC transporter permease [Holosporales bacterium]
MMDFLTEPLQYSFLKRALISCICLALGSAPVGVLLVLRRMSLMGDALSHAVLPGAAIGYMIAGLSLPILGIGGFIAGLIVALLSGLVSRYTDLKEDASFAGFFLIAMALGVLLISLKHNSVDLIHILFGSALAVDSVSLVLMGIITTLTLILLATIMRPLLIECFDPHFFKASGGKGGGYHSLLLVLVVLNLISGFQALGTLLSLGIMMLPAITARFWAQKIWNMFAVSILIALLSGAIGLLLSYYQDWPSGPSIVLVSGVFYILSLIAGPQGSMRYYLTVNK